MSQQKFIQEPTTSEEYWHNAKFQCDNVSGWIYAKDVECALIKLECLKDALEKIKQLTKP